MARPADRPDSGKPSKPKPKPTGLKPFVPKPAKPKPSGSLAGGVNADKSDLKPFRPANKPKPIKPTGGSLPANYGTAYGTRPKPGKPSASKPGKPKPATSTRPASKAPSRVVNRFGTQPTRGSGGSNSNRFSGSSSRGGATGSTRASSVSRGVTGANQTTPAGPDPLDKLVDEIIASRIAPIQDERRQLREQSAGDINQLGRLNEGFQQNLTGLKSDTSSDMGAAMARAMELRGYSADTLAKGQEWAKSLMAPTNGGTGSLQTAESSAQTLGESNAAFDAMGAELASRGSAIGDWLTQQSAIGTAQTNEQVQQQMLARQAAERAMNSKIAQEKGQKSEMLYGMRQAEQEAALKQQVAEAEWGLKAQAQASTDAYRQGQLDLGAQRNAIAAARLTETANQKPKGNPGRYGNIDKKYDSAIKGVWDSLHKRAEDGSLATPWRTAFDEITDQGLPANTAALLVTQWFPDSITKSDPRNIRELLANRGVSAAAQANIIKRFFGPKGWAQANRKAGLAGAVQYGQQAANSIQN